MYASRLAFFLLCVTQPLCAATINVGPPPASIQAAIDSASNGDTIQLSAGVYVQEVQIVSKSLDIVGAGQDTTVIKAPDAATHLTQNFAYGGSNFWCVLMVENQAAPAPETVNVSDLTVDGSTQQDTVISPIYGNSDRFFAIGYHNAGGTVLRVHATNTRQSANFTELAGGGILNASGTGSVTFIVNDSLVDFYQRSGIDVRGPTVIANVMDSTVNRGYALAPNTATAVPIGIQFSGQSAGQIANNIVIGNISTVVGAAATGILPFGAGATFSVSGNTLDNNDIGIAAISNASGLSVTNNAVSFSGSAGVNAPEGIYIQDTAGLTNVGANTMTSIPGIAMDLEASADESFQLTNNHFLGGQTGLHVAGAGASGPQVTMSGDYFGGVTGNYIEESASPHDIWPSTQSVSFDGLVSGHMTTAEFNQVLAKIIDKHDDASLGLVLDFIPATAPTLTSISPASGPAAGNTGIAITGTGFLSSNTTVAFGPNPATAASVVSDTKIIATAPAGDGVADVTVTTSFGTTPIVPADVYLYVNPLISVQFAHGVIAPGAANTLTITLFNTVNLPATLTASLDDPLEANLVVAQTPNASTTCSGGIVSAAAGGSSLSLSAGAVIPASGTCIVRVDLTSAIPGTYLNAFGGDSLHTDLGNSLSATSAGFSVVAAAPSAPQPAPIGSPWILALLAAVLASAAAARTRPSDDAR